MPGLPPAWPGLAWPSAFALPIMPRSGRGNPTDLIRPDFGDRNWRTALRRAWLRLGYCASSTTNKPLGSKRPPPPLPPPTEPLPTTYLPTQPVVTDCSRQRHHDALAWIWCIMHSPEAKRGRVLLFTLLKPRFTFHLVKLCEMPNTGYAADFARPKKKTRSSGVDGISCL